MRGSILGVHAAAIIAIVNQQLVVELFDMDFNLLRFVPILEAMVDRVEDQIE